MDTTCDAKAYKLEIKRHPLNMWIADFNHAVSATCLCNSNVQYVVNHTVTPSRLTNTLLCRAVSCRVVSCRVVSRCVVSCRAVSRRVVSCCLCRVRSRACMSLASIVSESPVDAGSMCVACVSLVSIVGKIPVGAGGRALRSIFPLLSPAGAGRHSVT